MCCLPSVQRLASQVKVMLDASSSDVLCCACTLFHQSSNRSNTFALLQDDRPIALASSALTETDTRYAVVEKEVLAIVFALDKWHQFTHGHSVVVNSDHTPLEAVSNKSMDKTPKRLLGILLRSSAYDVEVKYMEV